MIDECREIYEIFSTSGAAPDVHEVKAVLSISLAQGNSERGCGHSVPRMSLFSFTAASVWRARRQAKKKLEKKKKHRTR